MIDPGKQSVWCTDAGMCTIIELRNRGIIEKWITTKNVLFSDEKEVISSFFLCFLDPVVACSVHAISIVRKHSQMTLKQKYPTSENKKGVANSLSSH